MRTAKIIIGILILTNLATLMYALNQKTIAEQQTVLAMTAEAEAIVQRDSAEYQKNLAIQAMEHAEMRRIEAEEAHNLAVQQYQESLAERERMQSER